MTKDEAEGGCEQWVHGCHNNANAVSLRAVIQWVREALQPDDQQLREELPLPSLAPLAFPSAQNQEHSKHSKDMDAPAEPAGQQEGKKGN